MITTNQIREIIENDLNNSSLQTSYMFHIGTEEIQQNKLPNNTDGNMIVDNNIYGVFNTIAGQFEALQGQDLTTLQAELILYPTKSQMSNMFTILSTYQSQTNAVPLTIDDYNVIPVFDALRPQDISQFQGEDRIPFNIRITYTIASVGIISNSIILQIDGVRQIVLECNTTMSKATQDNPYDGDNVVKSIAQAKSIVMVMRILNIPNTINAKLKDEIFNVGYDVNNVYNINYNDGQKEYTLPMILYSGSHNMIAGDVATLSLTFKISR